MWESCREVLTLSLLALIGTLAAAVARPRWMPDALAAALGAAVVIAAGAISPAHARDALGDLAPTVAFLAALLVLADGCRRHGLFEAIGAQIASRASSPRRLLALVFAAATAVTAVLSLDATVVLLTPVVFAAAARVRISPKPHVYACSHLANSASLLLPVSNLTNLLAFGATGLSFPRFAALMALPTAAVVAVEWAGFQRAFAPELERPHRPAAVPAAVTRIPRRPLAVVALTLIGFLACERAHVSPAWAAAAGAALLARPRDVIGAAEPGFLVFVLGLGVIVAAAGEHGLGDAAAALLPAGDSLPELLLVAAVAAVLANLVSNLPAILILLPVLAPAGPLPVLAALIGTNVGPNLTYAGSLATLLWRRVLHHEDADVELREFVRVGLLTVPAGVVAATAALWFAGQL
jgi:arsenical pump membrane protein